MDSDFEDIENLEPLISSRATKDKTRNKRGPEEKEGDSGDEELGGGDLFITSSPLRKGSDSSRPATKRQKITTTNNNNEDEDEGQGYVRNLNFDDILNIPDPLLPRVKYRRVLRIIPPQGVPYIPVTTENGSRVYLRILEKKKEEGEARRLISTEGGGNRKLFPNWEYIKEHARILKDKFHENVAAIVDSEQHVLGNEDDKDENDNNLWAEKYKPRSYLDLLSEEGINKTLLHWLKLWDKSVFGNDYLSKVKHTKEKYASLEAKEKEKMEKFKRFQKFQNANTSSAMDDEYDDMGRPKVKVALLHGPPGLGKTTCAHIVAKQAGYNVREMNASDDRSVEIFRKTLDDALQSRAETFNHGRPNCLIIDEIDGAPTATVNILIELISGNAVEKGKKKLKKVLKRPVICICNDLYAQSLKELRKHAMVVQFSGVQVQSLVSRLNEISLNEKLYLDNGTLRNLCEKSDCDIRSCLSTLQFMKKKRCSPSDALFAQIGVQDKAKGIFAVWSDIFMIPNEGKRKQSDIIDPTKPSARFAKVLKVVQTNGEYERLLDGVFENYLRVKYRDCYFESILEGLAWTTWFQELHATINYTQNYQILGYLPLHFVMCHFLFGQRTWFKVNFPSSELHFKTTRAKQTVSSVLSEVAPSVGRFLNSYDAVVDLFPALSIIIQPATIRPVPTQIWSPRERETLRNIVNVMLAYDMSYTQVKNVDTGAYTFNLEPDICTLSKFEMPDNPGSKKSFPYAVKQLVARELETERLRRSDGGGAGDDCQQGQGQSQSQSSSSQGQFKVPDAPKTFLHQPKKKPSASPEPVIIAKDFFGRVIQLTEQGKQDLLETQKRRGSGISFRYKEGYSNAVRKSWKMKDLM